MDLQPYLTAFSEDLARATALADDHTREVAGRVATAIEPALRLALVQALSDAAASITSELDGAVVTIAMEGRDPVIAVHGGQVGAAEPPTPAAPAEEDDTDTARVTVRLPASLKGQAEGRAAQADQSLNTWIVQAVRRALAPAPPSAPLAPGARSRRVTGWA